ncbi:MAG: hypothetical protein AAB879_01345 [Patescibacteria group bacterium]
MNHLFYVFYESSEDDPSNGDLIEKVCVDGKVHMTFHMTFNSSWYDQSGCEAEVYDCVYYGDLVPCDGSCLPTRDLPPEAEELVGSCLPTRDLPPEAEELVRKFLASDGKERGTYERETGGYPDAVDDAVDDPENFARLTSGRRFINRPRGA